MRGVHSTTARFPVARALLVAIALVVWAPSAHAEHAPLADLEPHVHGSAIVRGSKLIQLARRQGDLAGGLKALGLDHLPPKQAIRQALRMMDLSQPNHNDAYEHLGNFRKAAFQGRGYAAWVRKTVDGLRAEAKFSYVQLSAKEAKSFTEAARAHRIDLDGVGILLSLRRDQSPTPAMAELLSSEPSVIGFDFLGPEVIEQSASGLRQAIDMALKSKADPVLRIHAGEGYLGNGGEKTVNQVLDQLARRADRDPELRRLRVVLGHAARIRDIGAAQRSLDALTRRKVQVLINVNPLSNVIYHSVPSVARIDALKLKGTFVAGRDNVGTLAKNRKIVRLLLAGRVTAAEREARPYQALRDRWRAQRGQRLTGPAKHRATTRSGHWQRNRDLARTQRSKLNSKRATRKVRKRAR